ncbi:hypothetical protein F5Y16DRAFT_402102 [Xylariaceae sp. FL0255]|nr:hypothetical protein F5Y16DRAFT_402102 [Xylariaceae sp. FL0255]
MSGDTNGDSNMADFHQAEHRTSEKLNFIFKAYNPFLFRNIKPVPHSNDPLHIMPSTIFVVAATGSLGKPVALDLVKNGWNVKTTTRNTYSPAAKELAAAGVEVITGD